MFVNVACLVSLIETCQSCIPPLIDSHVFSVSRGREVSTLTVPASPAEQLNLLVLWLCLVVRQCQPTLTAASYLCHHIYNHVSCPYCPSLCPHAVLFLVLTLVLPFLASSLFFSLAPRHHLQFRLHPVLLFVPVPTCRCLFICSLPLF